MRYTKKAIQSAWDDRIKTLPNKYIVKTIQEWILMHGVLYASGGIHFKIWNPFYYPAEFLPFALAIVVVANISLYFSLKSREKRDAEWYNTYYTQTLERFKSVADKHRLTHLKGKVLEDGTLDFEP